MTAVLPYFSVRASYLPLLSLLACAAPAARVPLTEVLTPALPEASEAFERSAHRARGDSPPGAGMPETHVRAWQRWLAALELSPEAAQRAQLAEALALDAQHFGDFPPELAEQAMALLRHLTTERPARAVDPRNFRWPVAPVVVSSPWGSRVHPVFGEARFHAGVDLEVPAAHPVTAAFDGVVRFSGWNGAHGLQVELQHDTNWTTRYSHLQDVLVEDGITVRKGDVIALSGQTGLATGPHLHFELLHHGVALDPEQLLPVEPSLLSERP